MRKIILILTVFLIAACSGSKKSNAGAISKYTIEDLGKMNSDDLHANYPDANIAEGIDLFEEGTEERAYSILYPGTENELQITWQNEDRKNIYDLRYTKSGKWKSKTGIDIGTGYDELNKKNGRKISFYGFGWDYSGAVDWNEGKLENTGLRVFLAPENDPENKFYKDQIIEATPAEIEALDLKVAAIVINYAV
ncbi:hypothetical protein [Christiangramia sabulilitoris]|uniref:Lipoprotein n=1 Tax=Christiangramia sabulilitoris TaxID=2583991 RepID=A0A550I8B1_9FLAO|nr:hypothetical protein [Christiangramia sabulilitoris]TRO67209.1 hypothetical protein FGM01_04815 [Christiangramia sabulilitoris]